MPKVAKKKSINDQHKSLKEWAIKKNFEVLNTFRVGDGRVTRWEKPTVSFE